MSSFRLSDDDLQPPEETISIMAIAHDLMQKYGRDFHESYQGKAFRQMVEELPMADLRIEKAYQRNPNEPHILSIRDGFEPNSAMLPLVIRRRYNGCELVLPDGQQRAIAMAMLGFEHCQCIVVEAWSLLHEAEIFRRINIIRKSVPTPVTHRNEVVRREPKAIILERTVREAGFTIAEKAGNRTIKGISRLHATGAAYTYPILGLALEAYRTIWPDHKDVHLYLNSGIAMLLWTYLEPESPTHSEESERDVNPDLLAERIRRRFETPQAAVDYVVPEVKQSQRWRTGGRPSETFRRENDLHYARSLITAFNTNLRPSVRTGTRRLSFDRVYQSYLYMKGDLDKPAEPVEDPVIALLTHEA